MHCIQNKIYYIEKKIHFVQLKTLNINQPRNHDTQYSSIYHIKQITLHSPSEKHKCHIKYCSICFEVQHTKTLQCKYVVFYHDEDAMNGRILLS